LLVGQQKKTESLSTVSRKPRPKVPLSWLVLFLAQWLRQSFVLTAAVQHLTSQGRGRMGATTTPSKKKTEQKLTPLGAAQQQPPNFALRGPPFCFIVGVPPEPLKPPVPEWWA
jgi:hypothetical protein